MLVKQLDVGHTHEHQVLNPGRLGSIDGGAALLELQIIAFLGSAKIVGDDEHFFGATLSQGSVQVRAQRVVANYRLHALGGQRVVAGPRGAVHLKAGFPQRPANIAPDFAGGIEYENFFSGHENAFVGSAIQARRQAGRPNGVISTARNHNTGPPKVPALNSMTPANTMANRKDKSATPMASRPIR